MVSSARALAFSGASLVLGSASAAGSSWEALLRFASVFVGDGSSAQIAAFNATATMQKSTWRDRKGGNRDIERLRAFKSVLNGIYTEFARQGDASSGGK